MRWIVLAGILVACSAPDPLTPPPAGTCTADAKLPRPPAPSQRSIPVLVKWANTAATTANRAIIERDVCRGSYERLNAWAQSVSKSK